jgi:hypothetical protein
MTAARRLALMLGLAVATSALLFGGVAQAEFGIHDFSVAATNADGTADLKAGSHPANYTVQFSFNLDSQGELEDRLRDLILELPPGLVGDPQAVPRCSGAAFEGGIPACPTETQIGVALVTVAGLGTPFRIPLFNLTPPLGVPASIGFSLFNSNSFLEASLRTGDDYGITVSDLSVPSNRPVASVTAIVWGVPAAAEHDGQRGRACLAGSQPCPVDSQLPPRPFLTLPTSCGGPLKTTIRVDGLNSPGVFHEASAFSLDNAGQPAGLNGCERVPFAPTVTAQPDTAAADTASGLHVNVHVPQNQNPDGLASSTLKDTTLALPAGLAVNPSAANGLAACSQADVGFLGSDGGRLRFTPGAAQCPQASKLGTVSIQTPLLDHPVAGAIYLAQQGANPFGSLLALYLTVHDPQTGVVIKLAGQVTPDPLTGQLTARFEQNPQLPFEDLSVDLFGGSRGSLTTPATCGRYATQADLTPWTAPEAPDVHLVDSFPIDSGADGAPCAGSEAQLPNSPGFEAGTTVPLAGAYSPFMLRFSRANGSQRLASIETTLPPGLTGKLAGIPYCAEAQIAAAAARSKLGEGAAELANPSCPSASAVGTVTVGAGSGSPFFVQGQAYLAGPYRGASLSLAIVAPAVAGPFDLGTVVVRTALYVNPITAQIHAVSDQIPTILHGIPLGLRSVAVDLHRPDFTLNPTSCEQMAISGTLLSPAASTALVSSRFGVAGCEGLGFKPHLSLQLKGPTRRAKNPALKAVLTQPAGEANIDRVSVVLPRSEFIDSRHVNNPCTRPQFAAGACPPSSILGRARAYTPLLAEPLEGLLYFRSNGGERELPDLVVALHGQIDVNLVGFIDGVRGNGTSSRTRVTFATVPDAPVSKFVLEMKGGQKGLLQNSVNLCTAPHSARVRMAAHNGKSHDFSARVRVGCKKR